MNWNELAQKGVDQGILPAEALRLPPPAVPHPWPLIVMSFLGALLAALPVIGFIGLFLGDTLMNDGVAAYIAAAVLIGVVCAVLRSERLPLFVESLSLTLLMAGFGLLCYAVFRDIEGHGEVICGVIALILALVVPVRWVKGLLASVSAGLFYALTWSWNAPVPLFYLSFLLILVWLAGLVLQQDLQMAPGRARLAIDLEWMLGGLIVLVLLATVVLPEMGFLYGRSFTSPFWHWIFRGIGVLACLSGGVWLLRRWPGLRNVIGVGVLLVLSALCAFMPRLGLVALIGLVALVTGRRVQASAAAIAGAWVIGRFYYDLQWNLVTKAEILIAAGCILAGLFVWARRHVASCRQSVPLPLGRAALSLSVLGLLVTLGVVNVAIWQKEDIIAHGRPVYIRLAPVDPRSLMQGDYMALNFELAPALQSELSDLSRLHRPKVSGAIDPRGVVTLEKIAEGVSTLAPNEIVIELSPGKQRWVVVTDAWFFKEGDGARWSKARYGEFRVMDDGRALLVGMADEALQRIVP